MRPTGWRSRKQQLNNNAHQGEQSGQNQQNLCEGCRGRGHDITDCPTVQKENRKTNDVGYCTIDNDEESYLDSMSDSQSDESSLGGYSSSDYGYMITDVCEETMESELNNILKEEELENI